MKRISIVLSLSVLMAWPALAEDTIEFSTVAGAGFSWQLTNIEGTWQLSFPSDATAVDSSEPTDPILQGDFVMLPTMTLTNITSPLPGVVTGTLTPTGDLTIVADAADGSVGVGTPVFTASAPTGTFLADGMAFTAYGPIGDDLTITSFVGDYGAAVPQIASDEALGEALDLSFTGNAAADLTAILLGTDLTATVDGNLAGLIAAMPAVIPPAVIPTPGALLLAAVGTMIAGWLRGRRLFA